MRPRVVDAGLADAASSSSSHFGIFMARHPQQNSSAKSGRSSEGASPLDSRTLASLSISIHGGQGRSGSDNQIRRPGNVRGLSTEHPGR